ncbi:MAG: zinc ribbon domain-containing protein [Oscillospiraceae bacterium]|nr:zinc ribbon domain-containing protein [Oscillospiraceae bacterium]
MAMKALRCPQCNAELELDDAKEFGFCTNCGTKVMLHDVVEHTGSVQLDTSAQGRNRILLGNRAFEAGNWREAYDCFTRGLEDVPDDVTALYRKGICAVQLSPADNLRVMEFKTSLAAALQALETGGSPAGTALAIERDVCGMLDRFENANKQFSSQLPDLNMCHAQAAEWCEVAKLYQAAIPAMTTPSVKERILAAGVAFIDEVSARQVKYFTHSTQNNKGETTDHYAKYSMDGSRTKLLRGIREDLAGQFNNLPHRLERAAQLDGELQTLQGEASELEKAKSEAQGRYDAARAQFWKDNPAQAQARKDIKTKTWIWVIVGAVVLLAAVLLYLLWKKNVLLLIGGVVLLAVSFLIKRARTRSRLRHFENEVFPSDIKKLSEELEAARREFTVKASERDGKAAELQAFRSTNK